MKKWAVKIFIICMMLVTCATLLLTWSEVSGVQSLDGTSILTGNPLLSALILGMFFISVLFFEKARKVFFCSGLVSLCMLFSIMLSKYEAWGRFSNTCPGPYAGLLCVVCTIVLFILLFHNALNND